MKRGSGINAPPAEVKAERLKGLDIPQKSAQPYTVPPMPTSPSPFDKPLVAPSQPGTERTLPESLHQQFVVPFTPEANSMIVKGIVNGKEKDTSEFVVDTGASLTLIPVAMAIRVGIDPAKGDPFPILTANGWIIVPMVEIHSLKVGGAEVKNLSVAIHDFGGGRGLLGMDFLSHFQVNFNYAQSELTLTPQTGANEEARFLVWQQRFRNYYRIRKNVKTALSRFPEHRLRQELLRYRYSTLQPKKEFLDRVLRVMDRRITDLEYRAQRAGVPRKFWK